MIVSLITGGIFYLFIFTPHQALNPTIKAHVDETENFNSALKTAQEHLQNLPEPSTITPAQKSARDYANKIDGTKGIFIVQPINMPNPISSIDRNSQIDRFNAIIDDAGYKKAAEDCAQVLKDGRSFLAYHSAIMHALANLLEYDSAEDLSPSNSKTLEQRLEAARGGLQKTIDRINAAPKYQNDKSLNDVMESVTKVQAARDKLAKSVGLVSFSNEKQAFIDIVRQAQMQIISSRSTFWSSESQKLLKATAEAQKAFEPYLSRLQNL